MYSKFQKSWSIMSKITKTCKYKKTQVNGILNKSDIWGEIFEYIFCFGIFLLFLNCSYIKTLTVLKNVKIQGRYLWPDFDIENISWCRSFATLKCKTSSNKPIQISCLKWSIKETYQAISKERTAHIVFTFSEVVFKTRHI